jgi:hypothetical protein
MGWQMWYFGASLIGGQLASFVLIEFCDLHGKIFKIALGAIFTNAFVALVSVEMMIMKIAF